MADHIHSHANGECKLCKLFPRSSISPNTSTSDLSHANTRNGRRISFKLDEDEKQSLVEPSGERRGGLNIPKEFQRGAKRPIHYNTKPIKPIEHKVQANAVRNAVRCAPAYLWDDVTHSCMVAMPASKSETDKMTGDLTHANSKNTTVPKLIIKPSEENSSGTIVAMTNGNGKKINVIKYPIRIDSISALPEHMIHPLSEKDYGKVLAHANACGCGNSAKPGPASPVVLADGTTVDSNPMDVEQTRQALIDAQMSNGSLMVHPQLSNEHFNALIQLYKTDTVEPVAPMHTNGGVNNSADASSTLSSAPVHWNMMELSKYAALAMQHNNTVKNARMVAAITTSDSPDQVNIQAFFDQTGRLVIPKEDVVIRQLPKTVANVYVAHNTRKNLDKLIEFSRTDKIKAGDKTLSFTVASAEATRRELMNAQPSQRV